MNDTDLASWLSSELERRGWSARELARRAGVSHTPVAKAVSGERIPDARVCVQMAHALGVPPEDVLRLAGILPRRPSEPGAVEREREVVNLFRQLSDDARDAVRAMMRSLLGMPALQRDNHEPRTVVERMAYEITENLHELPEEDVRKLFDLMKTLRGDEEASDGARETMGAGG